LKEEPVSDYLNALEHLMAVEHLPAWSPHIRSADILRKAPKRHFVDPSLYLNDKINSPTLFRRNEKK
jgi:predicted AAA+ superfamily ATPase